MSDAYLGNPNLKKVNTKVEFTKEQIKEYQKCAKDPLYFMTTYIQIVSLDEGLVPFNMYPFQKHIVQTIHDNRLPYANYQDSLVNLQQQYHIFYIMHYLILIQIWRYLQTNHLLQEIF